MDLTKRWFVPLTGLLKTGPAVQENKIPSEKLINNDARKQYYQNSYRSFEP